MKPFFKIGIIGIGTIILSIILMFIFPNEVNDLPAGFHTPILAFEFAETSADVDLIFGSKHSPLYDHIEKAMRYGNYIDFVYLIAYSMFLFLFSLKARQLNYSKFFWIPAVLAVVALVSDALENITLLSITNHLESGSYLQEWFSIPLVFWFLFAHFINGSKWSILLGVVSFFPFLIGVSAFFNKGFLNEIFIISIGLVFVLLIIYSLTYKLPKVEEDE